MRPHDWFVEQRAGYVSGSLGGDELQEFERHLAGCEECTLEVTRLEQELGWLPMGLPPAAPRPGFQQRVVENVLRRPAVAARRPRRWAGRWHSPRRRCSSWAGGTWAATGPGSSSGIWNSSARR